MKFGDLKVGGHFVLPNHILARDGVPSLDDLETLEVFRKTERGIYDVNAAKWHDGSDKVNCHFTDAAPVVKLT